MPDPSDESRMRGPENAEHEIKTAYKAVIEAATMLQPNTHIAKVNCQVLIDLYKKAYKSLRNDEKRAAERTARAARHLASAFKAEAQIAYLEPRVTLLPYLKHAMPEYGLRVHSDTAADLLNSVTDHAPPGMTQMPDDMKQFLEIGKKHLQTLSHPEYKNELLKTLRLNAAYEYGRVVELLALAYETGAEGKKAA